MYNTKGIEDEDLEDFSFKMNLLFEKNRLETFKGSWVFGDDKACNAAKLAEAGFFFTGNKEEPDSVQCFFCEKSLDGWEEEDDPWQEHRSHSPQCNFVKLDKIEETLTLRQMLSLVDQLAHILLQNLYKKKRENIKNALNQLRDEIRNLKLK